MEETLSLQSNSSALGRTSLYLLLRAIGASLALILIGKAFPLGTSEVLLSFAIILGVGVGYRMYKARVSARGAITLATITIVTIVKIPWIFSFLPAWNVSLSPYTLSLHIQLFGLVFFALWISTWSTLKYPATVSVEGILLLVAAVYLFSGHRGFHLDTPKIINTLAWKLGIDQLTMLILCGAILCVGLFSYYLLPSVREAEKAIFPRKGRLSKFLGIGILLGSLFLLSQVVYQQYKPLIDERVSNGVGQGTQAGDSPLGFHSALGGTSQPAALVRLDTDYKSNPFSPMLYLREGALSELAENEMIVADAKYDQETPRLSPFQGYSADKEETSDRTEVVQAVYLLGDQKNIFGIDFPISVTPLKAPTSRFKAAFRVVSLAPQFSLDDLKDAKVGDPKWNAEELQHYLKTHPDPRYGELAKQISQGAATPLAQALQVSQYLSKTSIYTLSPQHEVAPGGDPVEPYLFGDKRGYCVHFAHATVYMLRALGIPSRIATGYLTDLGQAKDGHILLRMSDRHAWAEVYIRDIGWVPFDTQPEQVESHAETQVDMNTLEELMGLLEPDEAILPKDAAQEELPLEKDESVVFSSRTLLKGAALLLVLLYLSKAALRHGWRIFPEGRLKGQLVRVAYLAALADQGLDRYRGETLMEFSHRIRKLLQLDRSLSEFPISYNEKKYSASFSSSSLSIALKNDLQQLRSARHFKQWKNILSLRCLVQRFSGRDSA